MGDDFVIANHLSDAVRKDESYRCLAVLKSSPYETTQKVVLEGRDGAEFGPYIRKYFLREPGIGKIYSYLYDLQQKGRRFKYLPSVVDYYELDAYSVVVSEYIPGCTLSHYFDGISNRTAATLQIFPQVCDAVRELHEGFDSPVIHRDIKPSNVLINSEQVVLIDFGIARRYEPSLQQDTSNFGTRLYAPPEQFGYGQTDVRSDVYALGMLLCYCLAYPGRVNARPESSHDLGQMGVPAEFHTVILTATAFDPQFRYASVQDLKYAYEQASGIAPMLPSAHKQSVARVPVTVGQAWNIVVGLVWLLFVVAAFATIAYPRGDFAQSSLGERIALVSVIIFPLFTLAGYALLDKRRIKKQVKWLNLSFLTEVLIAFGVSVALFLVYFILSVVFGWV